MMGRDRQKASDLILVVPRWVAKAYIAMSVVLVPWIVYLALTMPTHHLTPNWDVIWTGFDIGLLVALICTGLAAYYRSIYITIALSATGALLLVDAWFDLMSQRNILDLRRALFLALVIELPLAFLSFFLASHVLRKNARRYQINNKP